MAVENIWRLYIGIGMQNKKFILTQTKKHKGILSGLLLFYVELFIFIGFKKEKTCVWIIISWCHKAWRQITTAIPRIVQRTEHIVLPILLSQCFCHSIL